MQLLESFVLEQVPHLLLGHVLSQSQQLPLFLVEKDRAGIFLACLLLADEIAERLHLVGTVPGAEGLRVLVNEVLVSEGLAGCPSVID